MASSFLNVYRRIHDRRWPLPTRYALIAQLIGCYSDLLGDYPTGERVSYYWLIELQLERQFGSWRQCELREPVILAIADCLHDQRSRHLRILRDFYAVSRQHKLQRRWPEHRAVLAPLCGRATDLFAQDLVEQCQRQREDRIRSNTCD